MKQYILNRTAVSISCDMEQDEDIATDDIFTQEIREMILTKLDKLVSNIPGEPGLVEITLSISEVGDVRSPEHERDLMNIQMNEALCFNKILKFERWLLKYGIGNDSHDGLPLEDQFKEIQAEATRLKGSEVDMFSYRCGGISSIAHLHPDIFEEFVILHRTKDKQKKQMEAIE